VRHSASNSSIGSQYYRSPTPSYGSSRPGSVMGGSARPGSAMGRGIVPQTPPAHPGSSPQQHGLTPPSPDYSRPYSRARSSRLSFGESADEHPLGLAGPRGKSVHVTPEHQAWVEGVVGQVRKASSRTESAAVSETSFGEEEEEEVPLHGGRRRSRSLAIHHTSPPTMAKERKRGLSFGAGASAPPVPVLVGGGGVKEDERGRQGEARRVFVKRGGGEVGRRRVSSGAGRG
jgi:hypothetical protein